MAAGKINLQKASGGITAITSVDGVSNTNLVLPASGNVARVDTAVTDNAVVRFDGATGKLQNSSVVIDDNGNVGIGVAPKAKLDVHTLGIIGGLPAATGAAADPNTMARISCTSVCMDFGAESNGHQWIQCRNLADYSTKYNLHLQPNGGNVLVTGTGALGYGTGSGGTVTQLTSKSTAVTLNKPTGQIIMNNAALAAGASVTFTLNNNLLNAQDLICLTMEWNLTTSYRFEHAAGGVGVSLVRVTNISGIALSEAVQIKFSIIKGANS